MPRNRIVPPNGASPPPESSRHAAPPKDLPSPNEGRAGVSAWKNQHVFLQASSQRPRTLQFLQSVARRFAPPNRLPRRRSNAPVFRNPIPKESRSDQRSVRGNNETYGDRDCPNQGQVGPGGISELGPRGSGWPNTHARPRKRIGNSSLSLRSQATGPGFASRFQSPGGRR